MTPERFTDLADAYGGEIGRWPAAERDAARAWLGEHPDAWIALGKGRALDAMLGSWRVAGPGAALAAAIVGAAPMRHAPLRRVRLWVSGFGATAALLGGLAAGALLVTVVTHVPDPAVRPDQIAVLGAPLDLDATGPAGGPRE